MSCKFVLLLFIGIALISGCQREPKAEGVPITEEQARHIVEQYHEKNSHYDLFGAITITSVEHRNHEYEVKWERKNNCEYGTNHVNDSDGTMGMSENSIC